MAITRYAKTHKVTVTNKYQLIAGGKIIKTADKISTKATSKNLILSSNKKVINTGDADVKFG